MDTFAAPEDDSKTQAEESVGCAWAFVGMLGITFGWLLNCGITMVAIIYSVQLGMESSHPSNPITSTQAFAAAIVVSVLAFTALAYLAQFSLLPRQLPSPVYRRWRWATLIGSVAYWLSS